MCGESGCVLLWGRTKNPVVAQQDNFTHALGRGRAQTQRAHAHARRESLRTPHASTHDSQKKNASQITHNYAPPYPWRRVCDFRTQQISHCRTRTRTCLPRNVRPLSAAHTQTPQGGGASARLVSSCGAVKNASSAEKTHARARIARVSLKPCPTPPPLVWRGAGRPTGFPRTISAEVRSGLRTFARCHSESITAHTMSNTRATNRVRVRYKGLL